MIDLGLRFDKLQSTTLESRRCRMKEHPCREIDVHKAGGVAERSQPFAVLLDA